jgi:hypothetical protein
MAATPKTMAEVLASSSSSSPMPSLNNNKISSSNEHTNAASPAVDGKEENGSSNAMIKTFPYLTITVYIPTACVGVLIGKRGSNIDSIQKLAAKESTKSLASSRGARNKSAKHINKNSSSSSNNNNGVNPKPVSPESVRISVVNYPPPTNAQHQQNYEHYQNPISFGETATSSPSGQQQPQPIGGSSSLMDTGVPPTYTELDFSDPQWTPIVIRADPIAAIYAANAIHDICCPEYVIDRNQLVYIMDVPVPAVAAVNTNNANLRHASIVGKRGNKLIQLSADHKCRVMVPPKQLGHNIIQLEAPLKECCSCLKAILAKLQASGSEEKEQQQGDTTKTSPNTPPSKNAKNNATKGNNNNNNNNNGNKGKNDNAKNSFQMTLIIQPLPSQTKLRNIARKTETKILKKKIPKSQRNQRQSQQQKQEQDQESKPPEQSLEEGETGEQNQEKQEEEANNSNGNNSNNNNNNSNDSKVSWRLTVVAPSEKKVMKAIYMLKVLNSKGYEVVVEELCASHYVDTSTKTVSESMEDDSDVGAGSDSPIHDGSKSTATTNGNNGRGGGRGGRNKKQRHRNNHRGSNGKDDNGGKQQQQQQQATTATATVGGS